MLFRMIMAVATTVLIIATSFNCAAGDWRNWQKFTIRQGGASNLDGCCGSDLTIAAKCSYSRGVSQQPA
jgi:hypothetical protein